MTDFNQNNSDINRSRRTFIKNVTTSAVGFYILPRNVLGGKGFISPSDKLQVAVIGMGKNELLKHVRNDKSSKANIAYLCDVDTNKATPGINKFPKAKFYRDYRELLEKEGKFIDSVSICSPDHTRAIIGLSAMQLGKHVFVETPMAHDVYEVKKLAEYSNYYKVVTHVNNIGISNEDNQQLTKWYKEGLIGEVHTVICFTNKNAITQANHVQSKISENIDRNCG